MLAAGCGGKPPRQEVDAAKSAVQEAIVAGAEQYAPEEAKAVRELENKLNAEMDGKDYRTARQTAIQTKEAAEKTKKTVEEAKARAKEAAAASSKEAKQALEKIREFIAGSASFPTNLLQTLKDQFSATEIGLGELDGMIGSEKFQEASERAVRLKEALGQMEQEVGNIKTKAEELKKTTGGKAKKK